MNYLLNAKFEVTTAVTTKRLLSSGILGVSRRWRQQIPAKPNLLPTFNQCHTS